ncbi:hypothetical protein HMPREF0653_02102 [Prevotella disiens JCM 6334 = ATCC 29426]|uniref:Uncharacterized protein n=1 Tax=Prevotella disiens JCM 6334 = ATCC 29426 TaxID=1235811 RepID=A0ABP2Y591_9BACT|nr:hypothetical protein HMPREF0653_02102 [Prevotella disiens JCM 6334 = ATCC 29426]
MLTSNNATRLNITFSKIKISSHENDKKRPSQKSGTPTFERALCY